MYHYFKSSAIYKPQYLIAALLCAILAPLGSQAEPSRLTTAHTRNTQKLAFLSNTFENVPTKKELKKPATKVEIFEFDESPRGNRAPFLLVHGLRGEHYPYFRWQKVGNHLKTDKKFNSLYKIYLIRYPTGYRMEKSVPLFRKALDRLYNACGQKRITMMALSIGGNLAYESLTEPETADQVNTLLTLGTPFHGSPLFSKDWIQYSLYKKLCWPWTRIDHSLSMRLYFSRNKNLQDDFAWDGYDSAIPNIGKFRSKLPLGPKGTLLADSMINKRLKTLNENNSHLKKKVIAYGAYLKNPYLGSKAARFIDNTAMYPVTLVWIKFPAHLAREHPVLRMLNRDIASVTVNKKLKDSKAKSSFLYAFNDGITPLSSALFLPYDAKHRFYLTDEEQLENIKGKVDVKLARAFANIDHLTFIDGFKLISKSDKIKDVLAPNIKAKSVFNWILDDLKNSTRVTPHIAEERLLETSYAK